MLTRIITGKSTKIAENTRSSNKVREFVSYSLETGLSSTPRSVCCHQFGEGTTVWPTLSLRLIKLSYCLPVLVSRWSVMEKSWSVHRRECNPVVSDSGQVQTPRPDRDYAITLAANCQMTLVCECAHLDHIVSCSNQPKWARRIRQQTAWT